MRFESTSLITHENQSLKKSSRKVRCPRGAEDDALEIPGAGGLEFDMRSGILAKTRRTVSPEASRMLCVHIRVIEQQSVRSNLMIANAGPL